MEEFFLIGNWYLSLGYIFSFLIHLAIGEHSIYLSKYDFSGYIFAFIIFPITWPIGLILSVIKMSRDINNEDDLNL